jgi:hypothetical protein
MEPMDVLTAVLTITLPILAAVFIGNWQTQRVIRATVEITNSQTLRLLREIKQIQEDTRCLLEKMHRCLLKLDFGFKANALMHGWRREDGVSPERARELPEPKVYDPKLRICYYKAA